VEEDELIKQQNNPETMVTFAALQLYYFLETLRKLLYHCRNTAPLKQNNKQKPMQPIMTPKKTLMSHGDWNVSH
jgi:hypothetical protein